VTAWSLFTFLLFAALLGGCGTQTGTRHNDYAPQQRASLSSVFYTGNPLPVAPSAAELEEARARVNSSLPWEAELLESLYPGDHELWVYATRDSDGDGLLDFWVSDYYGRFLEGDTDLDGDGIDNVLDAEPYTAGQGGRKIAGLPAQLDWAGQGKPAEMVRIQHALYDRHRILLVERSAPFTPELARSVYDVVTRVYRALFSENGTLPTLRIIATEESSLLNPDDQAGAGDFAQVMAHSQTLEIYRRGIDSPPVIQLGYLAHEIAHNIQFSYDYDAQRQDEIMRRNYFAGTRFLELVEEFGWTTVSVEQDAESEYSLFRPHYAVLEPHDYRYRGKSIEDWEAWLAAIYEEVGEADYLRDERITRQHILGDYSLSGPWEWYSDYVIAWLYLAMLDSLTDHCTPQQWTALAAAFQDVTVRSEWPWFRFENGRGAAVLSHLDREYPLDPGDVDYLAGQYLLGAHPEICIPG
jgi:hypothetical protein